VIGLVPTNIRAKVKPDLSRLVSGSKRPIKIVMNFSYFTPESVHYKLTYHKHVNISAFRSESSAFGVHITRLPFQIISHKGAFKLSNRFPNNCIRQIKAQSWHMRTGSFEVMSLSLAPRGLNIRFRFCTSLCCCQQPAFSMFKEVRKTTSGNSQEFIIFSTTKKHKIEYKLHGETVISLTKTFK